MGLNNFGFLYSRRSHVIRQLLDGFLAVLTCLYYLARLLEKILVDAITNHEKSLA